MMESFTILLFILLFVIYSFEFSFGFTCQGRTYTAATAACPDRGAQLLSMGGNLTINVQYGVNVPNKDASLPSSKLDNPYVKFRTGDVSARTSSVPSSSNPKWNENVNLGFLGSGTLVTVELWNAYSGILFADKLLATTTWNVPFCSYFNTTDTAGNCGDDPFHCSVDDSAWAAPKRRVCREQGFINFSPGKTCQTGAICVFVSTSMIPFQMQVVYPDSVPTSTLATFPQLNVAGAQVAAAAWSFTYNFGRPFIGSSNAIDTNANGFRNLKGALMFSVRNSEKSYGASGAVKYYAGVNFPADLYLCRFENDNDVGVPSWISQGFSSLYLAARQIRLTGSGDTFECYYQNVPATTRNQWGGVTSSPITLRTNTLPNYDTNTASQQALYRYMYILLSIPNVAAPRDSGLIVVYDSAQFLSFFGAYGLICLWFIFLVFNFLQKINYRIDRLSGYLLTRVLTGKDRNLLAGLYLNRNQSPCNIEFRAHLFHGMFAIYLCFALPFFLLIGWGMSCAMAVRPRALGVGVTFVGFAVLLGYFGYRLWENSNWRLSAISLASMAAAVFFLMIFLLVSLFTDPVVLQEDASINFIGLSLIFGTLNCVPCLLLIFKNDRSHHVYMSLVVDKISQAVHLLKQKTRAVSATGRENDTKINRILHALLGETYSINPKVPSFKFSTVIHEPGESYNNTVQTTASNPSEVTEGAAAIPEVNADLLREERKLYGVSLVILFVYLMIAIGSTHAASLAFLNIWALILLDTIHLSMSKGDVDWSPGFKVTLLVMGRLLVCGSPQSLWILNYSACYCFYSITLMYEMINSYLPKLSRRKAGEMVFGGGDYQQTIRDSLKTFDLSGGPSFCLVLLSICFLAVLIISGFLPSSNGSKALDVPNLTILGMSDWPIYVFGIIAFLVSCIVGLIMATARAFELEHHGLLRGWARETYLFRRQVKLPLVLAISTESSILLSGLLIYAITKASAVLVGCIFLPAIFFCLGTCLQTWLKNDFELIKWPRPKGEDSSSFWALAAASTLSSVHAMSDSMKKTMFVKNSNEIEGGDLEMAFNMMENLTQADQKQPPSNALVEVNPLDEEGDENPESFDEGGDSPEKKEGGGGDFGNQLLKGFTLPPLKPTTATKDAAGKEIKMPPLPLKSVLRRKRQNMTVKLPNMNLNNNNNNNNGTLAQPLVQDLRGRDNAKDKDQFGNKNDVIDLDDPWAQFEINQEEGLLSGKSKKEIEATTKAKVAGSKPKKPVSWIRQIRLFFRKNKYMQQFYKMLQQTYASFQSASRIHPTKYKMKFDEEQGEGTREEGDENEDEEEGEGENDNQVITLHKRGGEYSDSDEDMASKRSQKASPVKQTKSSRIVNVKPVKTDKDLKEEESALAQPLFDDDYELDETEIAKLNFWDAFFKGYLNPKESMILYTWFFALILIMFFGIALSVTCAPVILGFIVWMSLWLLLFFGIPIYKYFQIYQFDATSILMLKTGLFLHVLFSLTFLFDSLYSENYAIVDSIWMLDFLIYFPIFVYIIFNVLKWVDSGYKLAIIDEDGDGQISFTEALRFVRTFPFLMVMLILLNWQLYLWINTVVGLLFTLAMIISGIAYLYIKDWARNDYFLSPELRKIGNITIDLTIFLSFMTAVFRDANPTFPISVCVFTVAFKYSLRIVNRVSALEKGTLFYYSPYIMPVYSYHTLNQDVAEEGELAKNCLIVLLLGVLWGALMAVFFSPVNIGVTIACAFLLLIASLGALCSSYMPRELAKSNALLTPENIIESANYAKEKFQDRREPLNLEMRGFEMEIPDEVLEDDHEKQQANKTLYQKLIEKTSFEVALAIMADLRSLKYVKEDKTKISEAREAIEEDEYELPWYQQMLVDFIKASKDLMRQMYELLPIDKHRGWKKHSQAPFTVKEVGIEIFFRGRGPFGMFGVEGQIFQGLKSLKGMGQFEWLYPRWTEKYDNYGNDLRLVPLQDYVDYVGILSRVTELDRALDFTYKEETRCAIHFLLMLLISADSKLQREQVLFQKFLRENRFRLATNGIAPPRDIFSSTSFASINIPLVAIWLSTLSKDEQDRFYLLKDSFNLEQRERDELIDQSDYEELMRANDLKRDRLFHHMNYMQRIALEVRQIRYNKILEFQESLVGYEKNKFLKRKELWASDPNCFVELKDVDLYQRFRAYCLNVIDEYATYAQNFIQECETAQKDIHTGEYGRNYQFVDSEFPPSEASLGEGDSTALVLGWRCAPGVAENVGLFDGGTQVDDICAGVYPDMWLLSAISMIVAASAATGGPGYINEQIRRLFIPHPSVNDGELTYETEVGVYGIQIYRNSEWVPILVDDLFPMRRKEQWTNENRGLAGAHLKECRGWWLPLLEKAFAKYYGSYTALSTGYVHHALEDLTGCEAECIPLLVYSRGINKSNLWDRLLKYKHNGYILGAGTGSADFVDKEILEMGINFETSYTIYDILQVDNYQLIKLRNPPGDHPSWRGDWSAESPLWSKRLKYKCGYSPSALDDPNHNPDNNNNNMTFPQTDHNTFFMSFDDFLNIFRFLYVCKYYNPNTWHEIKLNGLWKLSNEAMIEQMELMHQFFTDATKDNQHFDPDEENPKEKIENNEELMNKKKVYAQLNSSGGLPTKHNPDCQLENNPYYSMSIYRPTDLKIAVTQYEGKQQVTGSDKPGSAAGGGGGGQENANIPFAIFIIKNHIGEVPRRLTSLNKDDIMASSGEARADKTINLYVNNLLPGDYIILVAPYLSGMEGKFRMSVLSNYRCDCSPIWPPAWMLSDGDIFSLNPENENFEDKMKRNFVKGTDAAKKNIKKANDLFQKGMRMLLGANNPFEKDEEDEEDDSDDEEGNKRKGGGGLEDEFVDVNEV